MIKIKNTYNNYLDYIIHVSNQRIFFRENTMVKVYICDNGNIIKLVNENNGYWSTNIYNKYNTVIQFDDSSGKSILTTYDENNNETGIYTAQYGINDSN